MLNKCGRMELHRASELLPNRLLQPTSEVHIPLRRLPLSKTLPSIPKPTYRVFKGFGLSYRRGQKELFLDECMNTQVFVSFHHARQKIEAWRIKFSTVMYGRP